MAGAFLVVVLLLMVALSVRGWRRDEFPIVVGSLCAHLAAAALQYYLQEYYYGVTDAHSYLESGLVIGRLLEMDFLRFAPEAIKAALHMDSVLPAPIFGEGVSSGTMSVVAGGVVYAVGPSLLVACLITSVIAWLGQCLCFRVAKERFAEPDRRPVLVGTMLMPSVIFWGSGFNKEAFVLAGFGALLFAIHRMAVARAWHALPLGIVGAMVIGLLKPYVLFPFVLALGAYLYSRSRLRRGARRHEVLYLVGASIVAIGGLGLLGQVFPEFGVSNVANTMADQQEQWQNTEGGSNFELGAQNARTFGQQLPYVPVALVNALLRPFLFEGRSGPMLGAAIEMTALIIVLIVVAVRMPLGRLARHVLAAPELVFCLVFTLSFAVAVGLATSNLGSLSRYRVPMMPLYGTAVLVLLRRFGRKRVQAAVRMPARPQSA